MRRRRLVIGGLSAALALAASLGHAATPSVPELVKALQGGGYVLVMRHAASPQQPPSAADADPANTGRERQLDAAGKKQAAEFGAAVRALKIPFGEVWSSPAFRARETVRLAGFADVRTAAEIGDGGASMQAASGAQAAWLTGKAAERPAPGKDVLIVTHLPNIAAAFGDAAKGLADGEALVFRAGGGGPELVGRIRIENWRALAHR